MIKVTAPKNKSVTLRQHGVAIRVEAGQSRNAPKFLAASAARQGCSIDAPDSGEKESGGDDADDDDEDEERGSTPPSGPDFVTDGVLREKLHGALSEILLRGDPADFTKQGRPRRPVVREYLASYGLPNVRVDTDMFNEVWSEVVSANSDGNA